MKVAHENHVKRIVKAVENQRKNWHPSIDVKEIIGAVQVRPLKTQATWENYYACLGKRNEKQELVQGRELRVDFENKVADIAQKVPLENNRGHNYDYENRKQKA